MDNIETLVSNVNFSQFSDSIAYRLEENASKFGIEVCVGATKACFIEQDKDYVTKIPLGGEKSGGEFYPFVGTNGIENNWDYCLKEYEVYQLAKEQGLEDFFAEVTKVGFIQGANDTETPAYHQSRVAETSSQHERKSGKTDVSDEDIKKLTAVSERTGNFDLPKTWVVAAIDFYGVEKVIQLIYFLKENNLSDFHGSNVGFMDSQAPVLFDYSSYAS